MNNFLKNNIKSPRKIRIAILGSTNGTNIPPIIDIINYNNSLLSNKIEISVIVTNKKDSGILNKAKLYNIHSIYLPQKKSISRENYDSILSDSLEKLSIDLILCIGWMRILSETFVNKWRKKCFNVHPSLLPNFAGGMDLDVHSKVIEANSIESGCTVHEVSNQVDGGKIIVQYKCPVLNNDTPESLKKRVQSLEVDALIKTIELFINNEI